jgi:cytochrome c oxidase cbb3-type subunit 4
MEINDLRGITTLLVMIAFVSVCVWAYGSKRKDRFEEDANLPFIDDDEITNKNSVQEKSDS